MFTDPLSDFLKLVNAQSVVSGGFSAGGEWAIRFEAPDKIKFFGITKGECWLRIDGERSPVHVKTGDTFLLTAPRAFSFASDLKVVPFDAKKVFAPDANARFKKVNAGTEFSTIAGYVSLDTVNGKLLSDVLPSFIHVRADLPQATVLQWILGQLVSEQTVELPGAGLASGQLAQLMFIQSLRVHLASAVSLEAGLLRAMSDLRIAPALRLMHNTPARSWHLPELAKATGMSRTTFAQYFKDVTDITPLAYLAKWRMRLAEKALREEDIQLSALAESLGYASESAFSNAFKRIIGVAPKRYRTRFRGIEQDQMTKSPALA